MTNIARSTGDDTERQITVGEKNNFAFQNCTHFQTYSHILAEFHPNRFCKRLSSLMLSSSNVDKLKMLMAFQLSTTDYLKFVLYFDGFSVPLHLETSRAVAFGRIHQPSNWSYGGKYDAEAIFSNFKNSKLCNNTFIHEACPAIRRHADSRVSHSFQRPGTKLRLIQYACLS